jgi:hypothetical protein
MMTPGSSEKAAPGVHLLGAILLEENGYDHTWRGERGAALLLKNRQWRNGRKPNPKWIDWLMGWPVAWTLLMPLETDKYQQWCASHGIPYTND